ncbi:hypothetical protein F503_05566 [Ophiostoma piceae UAMH 11346]|uniref:Erythromycin esterase n=1 Tax=Ophiostoma piceae (strain UAMH 11346) TaxID=1262450 RepID=S3CEG0_OPHP1|nr:hypothetical protein F503_05566 [Ophiostoma piceae UAMH 11346]
MPPLTRRRSARLASNSKPTGSAAAPSLDSLVEQNEAFEEQPASPYVSTPKTPAGSSPTKPSVSEMRPGKANGPKEPPSSALRLGFADIRSSRIESPTTAKSIKIAASNLATILPEDTPSKRRSPLSAMSPFTFRFSRLKGDTPVKSALQEEELPVSTKKATAPIDAGLSEDARRMMEELRGEAQKIRVGLEVEREMEKARADEEGGRKIAKPKSRAGRFSAAHTAQFDKMDSIANHPSAYRASKSTPVKSTAVNTSTATPAISGQTRGLKRTQSKANLDDTPNPKSARTPGGPTPGSAVISTTKKQFNPLFGNSTASTDFKPPPSGRKGNLLFPPAHDEQPMSAAKRIKQNIGDDASSSRPMSRDGAGSSLPRPAGLSGNATGLTRSHSTASIVTPTKSTLARSASVKAPSNASQQPQTPSKTPARLLSALKKSVTASSLHITKPSAVEAPVSFVSKPQPQTARKPEPRKMASLVPPSAGPAMANSSATRGTLPVSSAPAVKVFSSKTPAPPRVANRALPRFPATTPRRKVSKHVSFTPTTEQALMSEKSPSVFRSGIPRSALKSHQQLKASDMDVDSGRCVPGAANGSPSIRRRFGATVFYPDLSGHELLAGLDEVSASTDAETLSPSTKLAPPTPSAPGTFTFRSDKTISFADKPSNGFGSSPGQSSIRQVRSSTSLEPKIPGSFPGAAPASTAFTALVSTVGANKENARPVPVSIPHGITNKKRQRISEAEEEAEQEASDRAAKKRKNERVPEGDALLAPRLAGKTMPSARGMGVIRGTPQKASPLKAAVPPSASGAKTPASAKKRPIISMSRLNNLARPKLRK